MSSRATGGSKRKLDSEGSLDLEGKALKTGGEAFFGLEEQENRNRNELTSLREESGIYGQRKHNISQTNSSSSNRFFQTFSSSVSRLKGLPSTSGHASVASSVRSSKPASSIRIRRPLTRGSTAKSVKSTCTGDGLQHVAVHIVCAIGENLARETCVASLDAGTPVCLQVTKQGNGQTYAETLAYLEILRPDEILLNEGRRNSPLARKIVSLFSGKEMKRTARDVNEEGAVNGDSSGPQNDSTVVKFISRSCFDQTKGAEMLRRLARKETYDAALVEEYILLSSSHAVLHYTQRSLGASFSRNCLDINVNSGGKNRMAIDRSSLLQLELLTNAKTGKVKNSLISTIDCTKTTVGSRLLRTNLMAPPCRTDTINARLDLVDTFLQDEEFFYAVLEHLQSLPAVDKMLTNVAIVPRNSNTKGDKKTAMTARLASKGISALVYIKSTLTAVPVLTQVLKDQLSELEARDDGQTEQRDDTETAVTGRTSLLIGLGGGTASIEAPKRHHLLQAIIFAMSQSELQEICDTISAIFTDSTSFSRNANAMRHQECFALKSGEDGMMDVLRKAFLANVDDIYKKADEYAEVHGFHVSVRYSTSRGYYLAIPSDMAPNLPELFIQPTLRGKFIFCTTEEVHSLNIRSQDNVNDLLLMTRDRIQEVLDVARSKYDALASLSDAVALLDLCHSFADKVTLSKEPWSRPVLHCESFASESNLSEDGIIIQGGRYGIDVTDSLVSDDGPMQMVPNDTYATGMKHFTVISGINGSGKSTYLKQIAIIVLLAHCGSYVPAENASIPIRSRLCARMGTADDQENNISSFMLEMKETAFICNNASHGSLILLDELGRATSNEDGIAIAWAVSEHLLSKKSLTFFVSHYPQLCRLGNVYPAVQNQHLKASVTTNGTKCITYSHKVSPGPCTVATEYGVEMANSCGWPVEVVDEARGIERDLRGKLNEGIFCTGRHQDGNNSSMSLLTGKSLLKKLSKQLVKAVQSESSLNSLRQKLELLKKGALVDESEGVSMTEEMLINLIATKRGSSTSKNGHDVPKRKSKQSLDPSPRLDSREESSVSSLGSKTESSSTSDDSTSEKDLY